MRTIVEAMDLEMAALALGEPQWNTDFERACEIQKKRTEAHHAYCEAIGLGKPTNDDPQAVEGL